MTHTSTEQSTEKLSAWARRVAKEQKNDSMDAYLALTACADRIDELEASQVQRVPLSDEQISDLNMQAWKSGGNATEKLARLVESAHGITQEKQG